MEKDELIEFINSIINTYAEGGNILNCLVTIDKDRFPNLINDTQLTLDEVKSGEPIETALINFRNRVQELKLKEVLETIISCFETGHSPITKLQIILSTILKGEQSDSPVDGGNSFLEPQLTLRQDSDFTNKKDWNVLKAQGLTHLYDEVDFYLMPGEENSKERSEFIDEVIDHLKGFLIKKCVEFSDDLYLKFEKEVLDECFNYGAITGPLNDEGVTKITVIGAENILIEKDSWSTEYDVHFSTHRSLLSTIERIASSEGRRIDESVPYLKCFMKGNHELTAMINPLTKSKPFLVIRKFPKKLSFNELVHNGSISDDNALKIKHAVDNKSNIIISTQDTIYSAVILNAMSDLFSDHESIVTIESRSLDLTNKNIVDLEIKPASLEGLGEIGLPDLIKKAICMNSDRILMNTITDNGYFELLKAMEVSVKGSIFSIEAKNPVNALRNLKTLCLESDNNLEDGTVKNYILDTIDLVIQVDKVDGKVIVTAVDDVSD